MSWIDFWIIAGSCAFTILLCRVVPYFVLQGRQLSQTAQNTLLLIPPAAFAALVTNDLFSATMFSTGIWNGIMPLIASLVVMAVALKTKNLLACVIVGVAAYALLMMVPAF